ncbi:hypothetical protein B0H34DRAFT_679784 [Crassisporium funariophilum]|nr:hypothetical protein B0H34DRAFT_679784 [Crassisporium funariophilum]
MAQPVLRRRGRKAAQLPNDSYRGDWIQWGSLGLHLRSTVHINAAKLKESENLDLQTQGGQLQSDAETYSFATIHNVTLNGPSITSSSSKTQSAAEKAMWGDFTMHHDDSMFGMDEGPKEIETHERKLFEERLKNYGLWGGGESSIRDKPMDNIQDLWDEADHEDVLTEILQNIATEREEADIEIAPEVPSFNGLRRAQKKVREEAGIPTISWMSPKGNAFSFNDPRRIIANNGVVSEVWHARKWRHELDCHVLSPMYDSGNERHYFIDEPASLQNGRIVIPVRWLEDEEGKMWADAWEIEINNNQVIYRNACLTLNVITKCLNGLRRQLLQGIQKECQILTAFLQKEIRYTHFEGIKAVLETTHREPVKVRNISTGVQSRFKIYCNCGPGDNPAQSEASGHIGGNGNYPCRKCEAGGTQKSKESDSGFHALFLPGNPRSGEKTLALIEEQVRAACLGVAQTVKDLQTETGVKDAFTQSWIYKLIDKARAMKKLQPARSSSDIQAELLEWVGAHKKMIYNPFLKMTVQLVWVTFNMVNVFHVYDLVNSLQFQLTKAIGELAALLWIPEIHDLDQYLIDVETAAANVLDIAALIDPTKIIAKIKYHLLPHLKEDILCFGPLVGVATEVFESFNAIFRFCSVFSNHLAPSRDISCQLASQETVKHLLSGGWWLPKNGEYVRSGPSVRSFVETTPFLRTLIGWVNKSQVLPGTVKLLPLKRGEDRKLQKRIAYCWHKTSAAKALNASNYANDTTNSVLWHCGQDVVAKSLDCCMEGTWVFCPCPLSAASGSAMPPITGQIIEILQDTTAKRVLVVLDVFEVTSSRHNIFGMPVLHDCHHAGCTASGNRPLVQERIQTRLTETYVEHKPLHRYIINTHAFHNAHLIRQALPQDLTRPIPFLADRRSHHNKIAQDLRTTQDSKRAATSLKAAERKKAKALAAADGNATAPRKRKRDGRNDMLGQLDEVAHEAQSDIDDMEVDK